MQSNRNAEGAATQQPLPSSAVPQSTNLKPLGVSLTKNTTLSQQQQQPNAAPSLVATPTLHASPSQVHTTTTSALPSPAPTTLINNNNSLHTTTIPTTPTTTTLPPLKSTSLKPPTATILTPTPLTTTTITSPSSSSSSSSDVIPPVVVAPVVVAPVIVNTTTPIVEVEIPSIGLYEEIEDNSTEILGFDELDGFGMQVRTQMAPQVGANLNITFPLAAGVAISYASVPLNRINIKKDTAEALSNPSPPLLPFYIPVKSYYISAMLDPSQSLNLDYLHRYSSKLMWKVYGVTSLFEKDSTDLCAKLQFDKPKYNLSVKAATDNQYFGGSFLRKLNPQWYLGGELFFSNTQKSGGFSTGVQYLDKLSPYRPQWTLTANTMGDLTTTFTSHVVPSILSSSARFNFNTNSHESEFGVGMAYTPRDLPLSLKARWDNGNRWGVMATLRMAVGKLNLMATAGISGGDSNKPAYGAVLSIEI